jgi:hypothetical protein
MLIGLSVALGLAAGPGAQARARDLWSSPHPGVRHLHRTGAKVDVHVVVVDLTAPEVSLIVTRPEDRGLTVDDFARRYDVQVAMNANFFDGAFRPCGMSRGDGVPALDAYDEACTATLGIGRLNEALMFDALGPVADAPEAWMTEVVAGKPWLVREGVALTGWPAPAHIRSRHPRSAVGLSRDRRTLFLVVADGRRADAAGLDGDELAALFVELGAHDAFNLDGGGSTSLYVAAEGGIVNRPSDGHTRPLGSHIGVRIRPGARWYAARLESGVEAPAPEGSAPDSAVLEATAAPGETKSVTVRYRNVGRRPWPADSLTLVAVGERPSALWDPKTWASPHAIAQRNGLVRPGEVVQVDFDTAVPVAVGRFEATFVPWLHGVGALPEATPLRVALTVPPSGWTFEGSSTAAQPPSARRYAATLPGRSRRGGVAADRGPVPARAGRVGAAPVTLVDVSGTAPAVAHALGVAGSREASVVSFALEPRTLLLLCVLGALAALLWPLERVFRVRAARDRRRFTEAEARACGRFLVVRSCGVGGSSRDGSR